MYSLCIVWSTNYTHRKMRNISKMQSLCRVLCIVCIVFLFSLFLTYIVMQANRGKTLHFFFLFYFPFLFLHYFHFLFSGRLWNCRSTAIASFLFVALKHWAAFCKKSRTFGPGVRRRWQRSRLSIWQQSSASFAPPEAGLFRMLTPSVRKQPLGETEWLHVKQCELLCVCALYN